MSRHWNPDEDVARIRLAETEPPARWPQGATAGVALVAITCLGAAILLYRLAGPRDIIAG